MSNEDRSKGMALARWAPHHLCSYYAHSEIKLLTHNGSPEISMFATLASHPYLLPIIPWSMTNTSERVITVEAISSCHERECVSEAHQLPRPLPILYILTSGKALRRST